MWGLRLALDATYSVDSSPTGVGVYSQEILRGLADRHPEVQWLWCYRAHRFLPSFRQRIPQGCSRRLFGERYTPPAELLHGLNQRLPAARVPKAVSTFHDLFVLTGEYSTPEFCARFAQQAHDAAQRADLVIAVSEFTASQVCNLLHVERGRIRVVHHGVRMPATPPSADREPLVLSVGALQRRKNTLRLVEAFERMPRDWTLVLAGSSGGYAAEEILARIAASPRRPSIHIAGYVDLATLRSLYQRASIFAFPSLDEGFGMPVLDAMAHGVPVLTSNRSALPEVAGEAALLVDPFETDAIADGLIRLAEQPELRRSLADRGNLRARQFSWTRAVEQTWEVYRELLSAESTPR